MIPRPRQLRNLVLLFPLAAAAQPLDAFLESARRSNFDARDVVEARTRAEAEFGQAWGALLPTLTASGGWTHNQYEAIVEFPTSATTTSRIVITPRDQLDATLKAEMPLIDPARWLKASAGASSAEAARAREGATQQQVERQVVSAYYAYLASRAVLESAQRSLASAEAQLELTRARTGAGFSNELELLRNSSEVDRNRQLVAEAETLVATGARQLETVSGLLPDVVPTLTEDDLHAPPPLESLHQNLAALPQVRAAEADSDAARKTSTAASLALVPSVNAQFTQRFTNATGFQGANALYNAGVTFNWRLDAAALQALRAQQATQSQALIAAERRRRDVEDQLFDDWHQVQAALKKVAATRSQVVAARRASQLTHERSLAGVATQFDVIQTDRDLFAAEVSSIQASADLSKARALLAISAGNRP